MKERTFALIKPDAVAAKVVGRILDQVEAEFELVSLHLIHWTRREAEEFYGEHRGRPFFVGLVDFMCSAPMVCMILERDNAIQAWREMMGATNPEEAKHNTIRHQFGTAGPRNAVHGSDSVKSAQREMDFLHQCLKDRWCTTTIEPPPDTLPNPGL